MNDIVQKTADTVVLGIERNFILAEPRRSAFAASLLDEMLTENGLSLTPGDLRRAIRKADLRRRNGFFHRYLERLSTNKPRKSFRPFSGLKPLFMNVL